MGIFGTYWDYALNVIDNSSHLFDTKKLPLYPGYDDAWVGRTIFGITTPTYPGIITMTMDIRMKNMTDYALRNDDPNEETRIALVDLDYGETGMKFSKLFEVKETLPESSASSENLFYLRRAVIELKTRLGQGWEELNSITTYQTLNQNMMYDDEQTTFFDKRSTSLHFKRTENGIHIPDNLYDKPETYYANGRYPYQDFTRKDKNGITRDQLHIYNGTIFLKDIFNQISLNDKKEK